MRHSTIARFLVFLALSPSLAFAQTNRGSDESQIRQVLERQQQAWNRGDIEEFMAGYEKSEALVFTSGGIVHRGWDSTLVRYRESYPDRQAMGRLRFSDLEITLLGASGAVVLGRWELQRVSDRPHGVFTLVFRRTRRGWKIVHDHTSSSR